MEYKGSHPLIEIMERWGFRGPREEVLDMIKKGGSEPFGVIQPRGKDIFFTGWHFDKKEKPNEWELRQIRVALRKEIEIPRQLGSFDLEELEGRIKLVDWGGDNSKLSRQLGGPKDLDRFVVDILIQMAAISEMRSQEAKRVYGLLVYKYFADTSFASSMAPVEDLDAMMQEHIRKVIITPRESLLFNIEQAYNLLDGRYIFIPLAKEELSRWAKVDVSKKDSGGVSRVEWIPGSERFDLHQAIDKAGIPNASQVKGDQQKMIQLTQGDRVVLPIHKGGISGSRVFYADPPNDRLAIDQKETARLGLYEGVGQQRSSQRSSDEEKGKGRRP